MEFESAITVTIVKQVFAEWSYCFFIGCSVTLYEREDDRVEFVFLLFGEGKDFGEVANL